MSYSAADTESLLPSIGRTGRNSVLSLKHPSVTRRQRTASWAFAEELSDIVGVSSRNADFRRQQREAIAGICEENRHMEDITSDSHQMLSNADLAGVVAGAIASNSAILSCRRPPRLRMVERLRGRVTADPPVAVQTGTVNYAALRREQEEQLRGNDEKMQAYTRMIREYVRNEAKLHERFAHIV